jgi:hypothetical protein
LTEDSGFTEKLSDGADDGDDLMGEDEGVEAMGEVRLRGEAAGDAEGEAEFVIREAWVVTGGNLRG